MVCLPVTNLGQYTQYRPQLVKDHLIYVEGLNENANINVASIPHKKSAPVDIWKYLAVYDINCGRCYNN